MDYALLHTLGEIIGRNNPIKTVMHSTTFPKVQISLDSKIFAAHYILFSLIKTIL
jgi:hypothetical protein